MTFKCKDNVTGTIQGDTGEHCINPDRIGFKTNCNNCVLHSYKKSKRIDKYYKTRGQGGIFRKDLSPTFINQPE